jgi:hypothetical protein
MGAERGGIEARCDGEEGKWSGVALNLVRRRKASAALHSALRG